MPRPRRALVRSLAAALAVLTTSGAVVGTTATSADALTFVPDVHTVSGGPSDAFLAFGPGFRLTLDGRVIQVSHASGAIGYSAGQFGFLPSTTAPPVVVPRDPSTVFTPAPVFQRPPTPQEQAAADATAQLLIAEQQRAQAADEQASAGAAAAAEAQAAATRSQQAVTDMLALQQAAAIASFEAAQTRDEAEGAVNTATSALLLAPDEELATAQAALARAQVAYAAAQLAADAAEDQATRVTIQVQDLVVVRDAAQLEATESDARATSTGAEAEAVAAAARSTTAGYSPVLPSTLPGATERVEARPATVVPGQALALAAAGFAPGTPVVFGMYSEPLGVAPITADAGGFAVASFEIPASATGAHTLVAMGTGLDGLLRVLQIGIQVAAPTVTAPVVAAPTAVTPADAAATRPRLADSGVDPDAGLTLAAGLLLLGTALLVTARRHRAALAR
jgi:hypothetical protein